MGFDALDFFSGLRELLDCGLRRDFLLSAMAILSTIIQAGSGFKAVQGLKTEHINVSLKSINDSLSILPAISEKVEVVEKTVKSSEPQARTFEGRRVI